MNGPETKRTETLNFVPRLIARCGVITSSSPAIAKPASAAVYPHGLDRVAGEVEVEARQGLRRTGQDRLLARDLLLRGARGIGEREVVVLGVVAAVSELREEPIADAVGPGARGAMARRRAGWGGDQQAGEESEGEAASDHALAIPGTLRPYHRWGSHGLALGTVLAHAARRAAQKPPGVLGRVTAAITRAGGAIVAVDTVEAGSDHTLREITVECSSVEHRGEVDLAVQSVRPARVVEITDRTFEVHRRGKIHTGLNIPLKSRDDLSMAYTPGVARVCTAIAENRQKAFKYTIKANTVAVVSDGTAVLGLGDIGPEAAMPVMEGKAMLFKEFADVDAFPICLNTKDTDEIVETVMRISPTFGGINLEDISSPRCFEIEQRLQEALDIPVFHDDQHGTAIVTLAALINACRLTDRRMGDLQVLMVGAGAAGVAVAKILMDAGRDLDRGLRPLRRDPHGSRRLRGRLDERAQALAGGEHQRRATATARRAR